MKNLLLSALFLGSVFTASAQGSQGYKVSPLNATGADAITITIDPAVVCGDGGPGLVGVQIVRLHGGIALGGANWKDVVASDGTPANDDIVKFTANADGTWSKTITPKDYFAASGYSGDGSDIEKLCFVLNGGDVSNIWANKGNYQDPTLGTCGDVFVPLPVAAPFGVTATKQHINTAFSIHPATPNPAVTESAIRVSLKQSGNVSVSIKNVLGQTVATLANGFETAGEKTYTWNIGSANAGIYFYTVESAGFAASAKINVVR